MASALTRLMESKKTSEVHPDEVITG